MKNFYQGNEEDDIANIFFNEVSNTAIDVLLFSRSFINLVTISESKRSSKNDMDR